MSDQINNSYEPPLKLILLNDKELNPDNEAPIPEMIENAFVFLIDDLLVVDQENGACIYTNLIFPVPECIVWN
ncbi:MAG: hypothetical protein QW303_04075 [Nitrososphaerota archaeon]